MDLPMKQEAAPVAETNGVPMPQQEQQPRPQPQPGLPPKGQSAEQSKKPFPATKGEAMQFANDLLQILYDERTHANIVQQLDDVKAVSIGQGVGLIAGHLVGNRVADVRAQTKRQIEMRLIADALRAVVRELGEIAAGEGFFEMTGDDQKVAVRTAARMLDKLKDNARRPQA